MDSTTLLLVVCNVVTMCMVFLIKRTITQYDVTLAQLHDQVGHLSMAMARKDVYEELLKQDRAYLQSCLRDITMLKEQIANLTTRIIDRH